MKIVFEITEGTRVAVTRIVFDGATAIAESDLKKEMKTKEDRWWRTNAFLDRTVMEEDLRKIAARYRPCSPARVARDKSDAGSRRAGWAR